MMIDKHRIEEVGYALLRFVAGFLFTFHGLQKVVGVLTEKQPPVLSQVWIGGVIELVAAPLIAIGLLTRPMALLASGTMAVAYFQFHWKFDFTAWKFLPVVNGGEMAALYCFVFLFIAAAGGGRISVDRTIWRP